MVKLFSGIKFVNLKIVLKLLNNTICYKAQPIVELSNDSLDKDQQL